MKKKRGFQTTLRRPHLSCPHLQCPPPTFSAAPPHPPHFANLRPLTSSLSPSCPPSPQRKNTRSGTQRLGCVRWLAQVREQLKATDAWGRSLLTHAVLSGCVAVFDAVFHAAREKILDDEVCVCAVEIMNNVCFGCGLLYSSYY